MLSVLKESKQILLKDLTNFERKQKNSITLKKFFFKKEQLKKIEETINGTINKSVGQKRLVQDVENHYPVKSNTTITNEKIPS